MARLEAALRTAEERLEELELGDHGEPPGQEGGQGQRGVIPTEGLGAIDLASQPDVTMNNTNQDEITY